MYISPIFLLAPLSCSLPLRGASTRPAAPSSDRSALCPPIRTTMKTPRGQSHQRGSDRQHTVWASDGLCPRTRCASRSSPPLIKKSNVGVIYTSRWRVAHALVVYGKHGRSVRLLLFWLFFAFSLSTFSTVTGASRRAANLILRWTERAPCAHMTAQWIVASSLRVCLREGGESLHESS